MAGWLSGGPGLRRANRAGIEGFILARHALGWPIMIDNAGRQLESHWLQSMSIWRTQIRWAPPGDAVVVVRPNIWMLRQPAMRWLVAGYLAQRQAPVPPGEAAPLWAMWLEHLALDARASGVNMAELVMAAHDACPPT